jgi:phosphoglycolate phosphatase
VKYDSIIWDWNGTLLNDVDIVVETINQLLSDRNLTLLTIERYLEVFTFPVRDYYAQIGFDFHNEPFEIPALQFIEIYNNAVETCGLHTEVIPLLNRLQAGGYRQFILSAMEQLQLEKTVMNNGILSFFEGLCGLNDHYAVSKIENGKSLITKHGLNPERTLMIGDTIHDYEVAKEVGCKCMLVANGHQSKQRLLKSGAQVFDRLDEIELEITRS